MNLPNKIYITKCFDLIKKKINHFHRSMILGELEERDQPPVAIYGKMLAVIMRIVLSSEQVNIEQYKSYCLKLYLHLLTGFQRAGADSSWLSITPTLHKLLAHSWEVIQLNDGEGLKRLDESGLEGCNKILRVIRTKHARKISQKACNIDCFARMWVGSDPILQTERMAALPFCRHCQVSGHGTRYCSNTKQQQGPINEEDALVASLLISDV